MNHFSSGLTTKEASSRLVRDGFNELLSQKRTSPLRMLWTVLTEPMIFLLISAGIVYILLGEHTDALMLGATVVVVITITFLQERRTERTLEALRRIASPRTYVLRDGELVTIPGKEVVRDDIIVLREGDRVPADAYILDEENLLLDESLLTGESQPVSKIVWNKKNSTFKPGGKVSPCVYSGTLVVRGRGRALVYETGLATEMGKIGKELETIKVEDTLLHKEVRRIVQLFAIVGLSLCALVVVLYGLRFGDLRQGFLSGLTLAMAILPEEFPVILLIFMTLGAWRISKRRVLTRRSPVIETLGAATVLCVDKTGTITENRMDLDIVVARGEHFSVKKLLSSYAKHVLHLGVLASQEEPFDPIERELMKVARQKLLARDQSFLGWKLVKKYPLTRDVVAVTHVYQSPDGKEYVVATKGAPEAIFELCHLNAKAQKDLLKTIHHLSQKGLRVLGVAQGKWSNAKFPDTPREFSFEWKGLLGFVDPIRHTVPKAIQTAYNAGMRTIMITGDYPGTATYIAEQAGLHNPTLYITGDELEGMGLADLRERIKTVNVFARVMPEQKLHIIEALKANGEIVAMTGDGVNDAPALKAAHIGIAMGQRGTDVAREASSLVLLNDDFSSIVAAVRLGRRIFDNMKRALRYILAVHIPIIGMSFVPVLFGFPIVLFPAHIAFLELIIDPTCSIVFETIEEESRIMKRPPRKLTERLFNKRVVLVSLIQGLSAFAGIFLLYLFLIFSGRPVEVIRTMTFLFLVISNVLMIFMNLTWSQKTWLMLGSTNKSLWYVTGGALVGMIAISTIAPIQRLFYMGSMKLVDVGILVLVSLGLYVWLECMKSLWSIWLRRSQNNSVKS